MTQISSCANLSALGGNESKYNSPVLLSIGTRINDLEIQSSIENAIDKHNLSAAVNVYSYNNKVLLVGHVEAENLKITIKNIALNTKGVTKVYLQLAVDNNLTWQDTIADVWLNGKIKIALIANKNVAADRVKLYVTGGVVYLMGIIKPNQYQDIIQTIKQISGIKKVVTVFEYIESV